MQTILRYTPSSADFLTSLDAAVEAGRSILIDSGEFSTHEDRGLWRRLAKCKAYEVVSGTDQRRVGFGRLFAVGNQAPHPALYAAWIAGAIIVSLAALAAYGIYKRYSVTLELDVNGKGRITLRPTKPGPRDEPT